MRTADTSVLVASFATWHERHDVARAAAATTDSVIGHVATETYSVLTRLPDPHRAPASVVADWLEQRLSHPVLTLDGTDVIASIRHLAAAGVRGGATYDGLIALTAAAADATLVTLDRRAVITYERLGVAHELI